MRKRKGKFIICLTPPDLPLKGEELYGWSCFIFFLGQEGVEFFQAPKKILLELGEFDVGGVMAAD